MENKSNKKELTKKDFTRSEIEHAIITSNNSGAALTTSIIYTCKGCAYAVKRYDGGWGIVYSNTYEGTYDSFNTLSSAIERINKMINPSYCKPSDLSFRAHALKAIYEELTKNSITKYYPWVEGSCQNKRIDAYLTALRLESLVRVKANNSKSIAQTRGADIVIENYKKISGDVLEFLENNDQDTSIINEFINTAFEYYHEKIEELYTSINNDAKALAEAQKLVERSFHTLEKNACHTLEVVDCETSEGIETVEVVEAVKVDSDEMTECENVEGIENFNVEEYTASIEDSDTRITDELIGALNATEGVNAELIGSWLWAQGDTKPHKETLKAIGFRWSGKKSAWYLSPTEITKHRRSKCDTLDAIRNYVATK